MAEIDFDKALTAFAEPDMPVTVEFTVQMDFVQKLPQILSNIEKIKSWATARTENDRTLILRTDEDFEKARERCAEINKIIKSIDDKRKEVKKEYTAPLEIFEKSLKEPIAILQSARENLWGQVLEAEDRVKSEKEADFRNYWESISADNPYRTFEQIFDRSWLNKGKRKEAVYSAMDDAYNAICTDIAAIKGLGSKYEVSLLEYYRENHSIAQIIAYNARLAAAESRQQAESNSDKQIPSENLKPVQSVYESEKGMPDDAEESMTMDFRVYATKTQLAKLKEFLNANKIKYGRVPKGE